MAKLSSADGAANVICTELDAIDPLSTPKNRPLIELNNPNGNPTEPASLYEAGTNDRISKKNNDPTISPRGRFLVYSAPTEVNDEMLMLSIITTNRKRIAIAPT